MNAETLRRAMPGLSATRAAQLVGPCNAAMQEGEMTTQRRAAYFLAQIGHESVSLTYKREIADGSAYEGRRDLGNVHPGDGRKFRGRGFLQITGRSNATAAGLALGLPLAEHPEMMERDDIAWRVTIWFFSRSNLNSYADRGDFLGLTHRVNGGENGLTDRLTRLRVINALGDAILPTDPNPLTKQERDLAQWLDRSVVRVRNGGHRTRRGGWKAAGAATERIRFLDRKQKKKHSPTRARRASLLRRARRSLLEALRRKPS